MRAPISFALAASLVLTAAASAQQPAAPYTLDVEYHKLYNITSTSTVCRCRT